MQQAQQAQAQQQAQAAQEQQQLTQIKFALQQLVNKGDLDKTVQQGQNDANTEAIKQHGAMLRDLQKHISTIGQNFQQAGINANQSVLENGLANGQLPNQVPAGQNPVQAPPQQPQPQPQQ